MTIFNFDQEINRRGTGSVKWDRCGEGELPMFIADMDFPAPPSVVERLKHRAEHPIFGYTLPKEELFAAFINWYEETYAFSLDRDWLGLLPGIVPVLSLAANVTEDAVLVNTPNYPPFLNGPGKAGKKVITSPLKVENNQYYLDFADLDKKAREGARILYLCNPHNPVGRIYTREELQTLSQLAKKYNLIVVSDEIHCELVYDRKHIPFLTIDDYAREHTITLIGPGKTCNIPGSGLAFSIIPDQKLREKFQKAVYMLPNPNIFGIEGAIGAYDGAKEWKIQLLNYLKENRNYLEAELSIRFPKAIFPHTEATYLQWIDFRPYGIRQPAKWLREEAKIILNDGKDFGGEGYVRLNFGCPRRRITEALNRIERAMVKQI